MTIKLTDLTINEIRELLRQYENKTGLTLEIVVNVTSVDEEDFEYVEDVLPFDDSLLEFLKTK